MWIGTSSDSDSRTYPEISSRDHENSTPTGFFIQGLFLSKTPREINSDGRSEHFFKMTQNDFEQPGCTDPIKKCGCIPLHFMQGTNEHGYPHNGDVYVCKCKCHECFDCGCIFYVGHDDSCTCLCHKNLHIYKNHEPPSLFAY